MLKIKEFKGLFDHKYLDHDMLEDHYELYKRYVKTYNSLVDDIAEMSVDELDETNPTYGPSREMFVEQVGARNGAILHELYFENIINSSKIDPKSEIAKALKEQFPKWESHLHAAALGSRGWAVLNWCKYCHPSGEFYVSILDNHQTAPYDAQPLIVIDVYEHAYISQYHLDRDSYLTDIFKSLNWDVINQRYTNVYT